MSTNITSTKFGYRCEITIPYGELQSIIEWCQTNCDYNWQYKILNEAGSTPGFYQFVFDSEIDYINFTLWKK